MALPGYNTAIYLGQYSLTNDMRQLDMSRNIAAVDTTTFGLQDHAFTPTLKDGAIKASGYWKILLGSLVLDDWLNTVFGVSGQPASAFPNGDALGQPCFMCQADETDYKIGAAIAGVVAADIVIKPGMPSAGKIVTGVSLHALGTEVGTVNGPTYDAGATGMPTTTGWTANLHVTAIAGASPSVVVKIQHSTDGSTWADLTSGAFTAATTATSQQIKGAANASVNEFLRAVVTFGGTTTSITLAVSFSRFN